MDRVSGGEIVKTTEVGVQVVDSSSMVGRGQQEVDSSSMVGGRRWTISREGAGGVQSQHSGERGFQGMTAQQDLLGAGSLTGFQQQLQEAVTRAIVAAMASTRVQGGWPAMGGFPANSGLGAPQNQQ